MVTVVAAFFMGTPQGIYGPFARRELCRTLFVGLAWIVRADTPFKRRHFERIHVAP